MNNLTKSNFFRVAVALCLLCCLVLTGCSTVPSGKDSGFTLDAQNGIYRVTAVPYGSHSKQKFDIYLPLDYQSKENLDIFVCIHGGSYFRGDRYDMNDLYLDMVKNHGVAVATMDYRLVSPTNNFFLKEMFEDVCSAVDKIASVCNENDFKIDKAALMGFSAGGHFALLYSYTMIEKCPFDLVFCVDYVGPADLTDEAFLAKTEEKRFEQLGKLFKKRLGVKDIKDAIPYFKEYSPIEYVTPSIIPTICAYGKKDEIVPFSICESFKKKLDECGCTYELTVFPNSNHGLDAPEDAPLQVVVAEQIQDYMKKYF